MPVVLEQETVFTEFDNSIPADVSAPMRPHITGGHAALHRYGVAAEKAAASLGAYNPLANTQYNWPGKQATSKVDLAYAKVYIDDALLQYYQDLKAVGDTIAPVAGYLNRLSTNGARGFKTNTATYPRITALKDRDVAVGDVVHLRDGGNEMTTYVADLVADKVNPVTGAATSDPANAIAQPSSLPGSAPTVNATGGGASGGNLQAGTYFVRYSFVGAFGETWASAASGQFTVSAGNIPRVTIPAVPAGAASANIYLSPTSGTALQCTLYKTGVVTTTTDLTDAYAPGGAAYPVDINQTAGTDNGVDTSAISVASYNGTATGDITETYTITVTQAGTGSDLTTARFQVTSASGRDDQTNVQPAASASPTSIGTRGLTVTWTRVSDNFVVGQSWQTTVRQAWAVPAPTSGGTYTGTQTVTYIVRVSRGGLYADSVKPQISVTTDKGIDSSGPTNVTAAASAVSAGTFGITIQFSGAGLRKNDIYYIPVTGPSAGAYKTIVLGHNLTTALQGSSDMDLTLYLKKNVAVAAERATDPPNLNWVASATKLQVNAGVVATDSSFTDGGVPFYTPVKGGTVYVEYREWLDTYKEKVTSLTDPDDALTLFGESQVHPDNPLAYGVWLALTNANGQEVRFTAVADPSDVTQWEDVLKILEGYTDMYSLVPLTRDQAVIAAYRSHVTARSDDDIGGEWRTAWFNLEAVESQAISNASKNSNGAAILATLADDPGAAGTQYTYLTATSGNALFVDRGVAAGDVVRFLYSIDAFGKETYTSFVVASVVNQDTLVLTTGHTAAVATAQRVEVWRNLSKTQIANGLAGQMVGDNINKRLRYLWPDKFTTDDGLEAPGYLLCAAYAGYVGGIAPHQGLRNVQIKGVKSTPRSTEFFNNAQLGVLGTAGFFVVTTAGTGEVYAHYARTPDPTSVANREEATVRHDDAIRYLFYTRAALYFGKSNTTDSALALIDAELKAALQHGISDTRIERIGPLVEDGNVKNVRRHPIVEDKVQVEITVVRGFPINNAELLLTL